MGTGLEQDMEGCGATDIESREELWMYGGTERGDKQKDGCVAIKIAEHREHVLFDLENL